MQATMRHTKSINILVAEDNPDHAELIIEALMEFNEQNRISHVSGGDAALRYLRQQTPYQNAAVPDLVLLDIKMPGLDGISTLKQIKLDEKLKHIPVVMVTTSSTREERLTCFKYGANSYITKPLEFGEFSQKMKELNLYWALTSELPGAS